jgi:hypothetical protein
MSGLRGTFTFRKYLPEQGAATASFRVSATFLVSLQMQSLDFRRMMVLEGAGKVPSNLEGGTCNERLHGKQGLRRSGKT